MGERDAEPEVEWLPPAPVASDDAPTMPPTPGERAFIRYLVRRAIERRRREAKVA